MKEIKLNLGYVALVDDEDYQRCLGINWFADANQWTVYVCRNLWVEGKNKPQYLHRMLMGVTDPNLEVDHIDHNGLNCQRYNMRVATKSQSQANKKKTDRFTSSQFKGVCWDKQHTMWKAQIDHAHKHYNLGLFVDEKEAALAYDKAARQYHGEFAHTNFSI